MAGWLSRPLIELWSREMVCRDRVGEWMSNETMINSEDLCLLSVLKVSPLFVFTHKRDHLIYCPTSTSDGHLLYSPITGVIYLLLLLLHDPHQHLKCEMQCTKNAPSSSWMGQMIDICRCYFGWEWKRVKLINNDGGKGEEGTLLLCLYLFICTYLYVASADEDRSPSRVKLTRFMSGRVPFQNNIHLLVCIYHFNYPVALRRRRTSI